MPVPPRTHDDVAGLMDGYLRTQLLYVAARLRLADCSRTDRNRHPNSPLR